MDIDAKNVICQVYDGWYRFFTDKLVSEVAAALPPTFSFPGYLIYTFDTKNDWRVYITTKEEFVPLRMSAEVRSAGFMRVPFHSHNELVECLHLYYQKRVLRSEDEINRLADLLLANAADVKEQTERLAESTFAQVQTGIIVET